MATTFHVTNFKNKTIDLLTGISASPTPIGFVNPYNGAQAADPSAVPAGSFVFAAASSGPNLSANMSFAGQGISQLATARPPTTPANALTVSTLTIARLFTTGAVAIIDASVTLSGGGGAVILDTLNSVAGTGIIVQAFSFKLPLNNGGSMSMNAALVDRMIDLWTGASSTAPDFGKNTSGQCLFNVYTGAAPASADLVPTGTLLVSTAIGATNVYAAAAGGSSALVSNPTSTAVGTGTAGYARLIKNLGALTFIIQGSVGTAATDFVISTTAITSGVTSVVLNEATISL